MFAQLAQNVAAMPCLARWQIIVTDRNDARYDRDNLRQVFVQRQRWRRTSHAREHPLNCVDDRLGLCFQIWLDKIKRPSGVEKKIR